MQDRHGELLKLANEWNPLGWAFCRKATDCTEAGRFGATHKDEDHLRGHLVSRRRQTMAPFGKTDTIPTEGIDEAIKDLEAVFEALGRIVPFQWWSPSPAQSCLPTSPASSAGLPEWPLSLIGPAARLRLLTAITRTLEMANQFQDVSVGQPRPETDPEDEQSWWIVVPLRCKGSVEGVYATYEKLVKRFVSSVLATERDRIRIDVQVDES